MRLKDFLDPTAIALDLQATTKEAVLDELVFLLRQDEKTAQQLVRLLKRREALGSTGVGRAIAIPHCRALGISDLKLGFGIHKAGVDYDAVDGKPVNVFFLIVAPPNEISNQYLPVLGKIAQFAQMPEVPARLQGLTNPADLFALLDEKGV